MQLLDVLQQVSQQTMQAMAPTDLVIGTVTSASPLQITINTAMAPLNETVLYLTSAVVERKIPVLSHTHTLNTLAHDHTVGEETSSEALSGEFETEAALEEVACLENGVPLPVANGYITLNRALATGDKVLLLRVQNGQKFVVLSRIY